MNAEIQQPRLTVKLTRISFEEVVEILNARKNLPRIPQSEIQYGRKPQS